MRILMILFFCIFSLGLCAQKDLLNHEAIRILHNNDDDGNPLDCINDIDGNFSFTLQLHLEADDDTLVLPTGMLSIKPNNEESAGFLLRKNSFTFVEQYTALGHFYTVWEVDIQFSLDSYPCNGNFLSLNTQATSSETDFESHDGIQQPNLNFPEFTIQNFIISIPICCYDSQLEGSNQNKSNISSLDINYDNTPSDYYLIGFNGVILKQQQGSTKEEFLETLQPILSYNNILAILIEKNKNGRILSTSKVLLRNK